MVLLFLFLGVLFEFSLCSRRALKFVGEEGEGNLGDIDLADRDPLFEDAARLIVLHQQGSTSFIQRKLKLGYNRAGRIVDQLEAAGVVGPFEGSKAREVLIQDEINASQAIQWRMHTNATVSISGTQLTLELDGQTLIMEVLNAPSGINISTTDAVRLSTDPALPDGQVDQPNPGVTVITMDLPAGSYTLEVLFNPQWSGMSSSDFVSPASVALSDWSLTSHN